MAAGNYDIYIEQGASFSLSLRIKSENGEPVDLTGHVFRGKIKKTFADRDSQAAMSFVLLDQSDPLTRGRLTASLTATQTQAIQLSVGGTNRQLVKMVYDIESEDPAGTVRRWLQGSAQISPEVTR